VRGRRRERGERERGICGVPEARDFKQKLIILKTFLMLHNCTQLQSNSAKGFFDL
jgi:hypothetical protein